MTKDFADLVIGHLLLEGFLREEFHCTAYNVISYVVLSVRRPGDSISMAIDESVLDVVGPPSAKRKRTM
jgi:hypothetical protein